MLSTFDEPRITRLLKYLKYLINEKLKAFKGRNWKLYDHYEDKVKQEIKKEKTAGQDARSNLRNIFGKLLMNCKLQEILSLSNPDQ